MASHLAVVNNKTLSTLPPCFQHDLARLRKTYNSPVNCKTTYPLAGQKPNTTHKIETNKVPIFLIYEGTVDRLTKILNSVFVETTQPRNNKQQEHAMNLFILDENPIIAASHNCDIHVRKIILEAASCMCAAHWEYGFHNINQAPPILQQGKYRGRTHHNNHITKWVRESLENYRWTYKHATELCRQHVLRSKHKIPHASLPIIEWLGENPPPILLQHQTPFRQAVAPECYHEDPVIAYWVYYIKCKRHLTRWSLDVPQWFMELYRHDIAGANITELFTIAESIRTAKVWN